MSARLIYAIVSIILEEAAIGVIVLVGLPQLDIEVPLGVLIAVMVAFAIFSVLLYRAFLSWFSVSLIRLQWRQLLLFCQLKIVRASATIYPRQCVSLCHNYIDHRRV